MLGLGSLYKGLEYSIYTVAGVFTDKYKPSSKNSEMGVPEIRIVPISHAQRVEIGDVMYTFRKIRSVPFEVRIEPYGIVISTVAYEYSGKTLTLNQQNRIASGRAVCVHVDYPYKRKKSGSLFFMVEEDSKPHRRYSQRVRELHKTLIEDQINAAKQPTVTIESYLEEILR